MASAWGNSWGSSWGNAWGPVGGAPVVVNVPINFPQVTGRRIQWDAVVRMAGGVVQPHPYETYRFGGGKMERSFFENV